MDKGDCFDILISDNGRGMDHQFIYKKALEKGLIRLEETEEFNKDDSLKLIFCLVLARKPWQLSFLAVASGWMLSKIMSISLEVLLKLIPIWGKGLSLKSKSLKKKPLKSPKSRGFHPLLSVV